MSLLSLPAGQKHILSILSQSVCKASGATDGFLSWSQSHLTSLDCGSVAIIGSDWELPLCFSCLVAAARDNQAGVIALNDLNDCGFGS